MAAVAGGGELTVDLETKTITAPGDHVVPFEFDEFERHCLLNGLDDIARALTHEGEIIAYEQKHPAPFATTALP